MRPLIVGNWKTYISSLKEAKKLVKDIEKGLPRRLTAEVVLCPPAPFIGPLALGYGGKRILFGAQDVSFDDGAPTGDIMPEVLKDVGARYAIVGHAERRRDGDSSDIVAEKIRAALAARIRPIVCFGERERDRDGAYFLELERDIVESLAGIPEEGVKKIIFAYEPVWAIGAPMPPSAREIQETLIFIRKTLALRYPRALALKTRILYGGAVDADSAPDLIEHSGAAGFLVGRASAHPDAFVGIIRAWT